MEQGCMREICAECGGVRDFIMAGTPEDMKQVFGAKKPCFRRTSTEVLRAEEKARRNSPARLAAYLLTPEDTSAGAPSAVHVPVAWGVAKTVFWAAVAVLSLIAFFG